MANDSRFTVNFVRTCQILLVSMAMLTSHGQEIPTQEIPAQEIPAQEIPAQEIPAQEIPAQEIPAQEIPAQEEPSSRPNIVFIMADDLGFNDVGYHNGHYEDIYTPAIDRLANEGVRLENYYVLPVCTPTRSQFFSGRSQIHTGLQHKIIQRTQPNALPLDSPTLADKMKEAGYSTDMVGKWHLGFYQHKYLPTSRGFESFYGMYLGSGGYFNHRACMPRKCPLDLHNDTTLSQYPDYNQRGVYSTHLFTDEAVRVIGQRAKEDNPFFLYLSYQAVHGPLQVPSQYRHKLDEKLGYRIRSRRRRIYSAMTLAMDDGVARVVDALKEQGVWNNTVLVFSTDNGGKPSLGSSNAPLRGHKGSYYEGGVRGVGFVASPLLQRQGYVSNEMMHVTDWFPTFVGLANGSLNGTRDVNGFDQWETISQGSRSPRDEILYNIDPRSRSRVRGAFRNAFNVRIKAALRLGDYKIITGLSRG